MSRGERASNSALIPLLGQVVRHSSAARARGLIVLPNPITNILGRSVLSRSFVPETNTHQQEFEVSELPTGMYFLQVVTAEKQTMLKVE